MARILVTGGSGLLGRALLPLLADHEVVHFGLEPPGDGRPFIAGDLCRADAVAEACRGCEAVIHLAALHGRAWEAAGDEIGFGVNLEGTRNILEGAARAGARRVVWTSSIWAAGHGPVPPYLPIDEDLPRQPCELYGLTKLLGEALCRYYTQRHGLSTLALRPAGIAPAERYRPDDLAYLGGVVDVRDVAQAHALALAAPAALTHAVLNVTADSPLCRVSPEDYVRDPGATLARLCPAVRGRADLQAAPPVEEWWSITRAKELLGYAPRYNFTGAAAEVQP
jgi:nucleoside-diphosphate-sugar epimerase